MFIQYYLINHRSQKLERKEKIILLLSTCQRPNTSGDVRNRRRIESQAAQQPLFIRQKRLPLHLLCRRSVHCVMHLVRRHRLPASQQPRAPEALRRSEAASLRIICRRRRRRQRLPPRQHRVFRRRQLLRPCRPPFRRASEQKEVPQLPFLVPPLGERNRRQKSRRIGLLLASGDGGGPSRRRCAKDSRSRVEFGAVVILIQHYVGDSHRRQRPAAPTATGKRVEIGIRSDHSPFSSPLVKPCLGISLPSLLNRCRKRIDNSVFRGSRRSRGPWRIGGGCDSRIVPGWGFQRPDLTAVEELVGGG
ncbi:unnamed protein product [Linum tenue]|uniref:Uncharacterized protein n=1 Tax=Linum tenue TaxID=586396 RepID=A0AAV0MLC3_9ROSI|nr:unnamed protein product [Linum tenue]